MALKLTISFLNRVWQHVVCMGLDKNNIPDEYLCEVCKPRPIDRKRAKSLQARRRNDFTNVNNTSSRYVYQKKWAFLRENKMTHANLIFLSCLITFLLFLQR